MSIINNSGVGNLSFVISFYENGNIIYNEYDAKANRFLIQECLTEESMSHINKAFSKMEKNKNKFSFKGFIPENVHYFNEEDEIVIWETDPGIKKMFFKTEDKIKNGEYPVPRLLWKYQKKKIYVYALKKSFNPKGKLYNAPYLNLYSDGSVCAGSMNFKSKKKDFEELMKQVEYAFFSSDFTHTNHDKVIKENLIVFYKRQLNKLKFDNNVLIESEIKPINLI